MQKSIGTCIIQLTADVPAPFSLWEAMFHTLARYVLFLCRQCQYEGKASARPLGLWKVVRSLAVDYLTSISCHSLLLIQTDEAT